MRKPRYSLYISIFILIAIFSGCKATDKQVQKVVEVEAPPDFTEDVEQLIEYRNKSIREKFKNQEIVLMATGDIMLGRGVGNRLLNSNLKLAYKNLQNEFNRSDILFGNLENPISERGEKLPGKGICLRAHPSMVEILNEAGFDVLSLVNNHILDYGDEAIIDTFDILKTSGIGYVGSGMNIDEARSPYKINTKNKTIGFLAYDEFAHYYYSNKNKRKFIATDELPGTAPRDPKIVLEDVKKVSNKVDFLVVSLHWGIEESNYVTDEQRKFARELIDNGVDVILGHHPHVIQAIEIYKNKPIIYSLGNYIFDQNDENNKQGMVVSIIAKDNGTIDRIEALPIYIKDKREPIIAVGEKGEIIKNKILSLSRNIGTIGKVEKDRVIFDVIENP